jgi:hypothetical protein
MLNRYMYRMVFESFYDTKNPLDLILILNLQQYIVELAWISPPTKIITLLEFFNFVSEVSRLQYTSDQVTADAFGYLWG